MSTMNVLDATGAQVAIEKPLAPSRASAALSRPVVLSTEDLAAINALGTLLTSLLAKTVPVSTTGTLVTPVAASATAVTVLAANAARLGAIIVNDSTSVLYLGLSNTAPTSALYSYKVTPGDTVELPAKYTGIVKGIWVTAVGNAVITELT